MNPHPNHDATILATINPAMDGSVATGAPEVPGRLDSGCQESAGWLRRMRMFSISTSTAKPIAE